MCIYALSSILKSNHFIFNKLYAKKNWIFFTLIIKALIVKLILNIMKIKNWRKNFKNRINLDFDILEN